MYGLWTFRSSGSRAWLLGLLPDLGAARRLGQQFVVAGDRFHLAGLLADPDRQRRAPVAFARQGPIDVGFQEVAEPAVADVLGQPVDLRLLASIRSLNCVVRMNQLLRGYWISGSSRPASRTGSRAGTAPGGTAARAPQFADDVLVAVLDPAALVVGRLGGELAVGPDGADQRRAFAVDEPLCSASSTS
jgi:hypothetical protein